MALSARETLPVKVSNSDLEALSAKSEAVCENCVEVCPNRANISVRVPGKEKSQIIHIDQMCNECGNCKSFCPYDSAPYLDKLTLFHTEDEFLNSKNQGFVFTDVKKGTYKLRIKEHLYSAEVFDEAEGIDSQIVTLIETIYKDYGYLL